MIDAAKVSRLAPLLELVCARIGHRLATQRLPAVEAGVRRVMARRGVGSAERLVERARVEPELFDELVREFVVTETYFFREPAQFESIRRVVLPGLAARHERGGELRIWSAGCATGEEAYSIAALLEQEGLSERAQVLATDVSRHALATAREGVYSRWSLRGDPGGLAARYFRQKGEQWKVAERLRRRIRFEQHNLMAEVYPPGPFDVILCRNVLIYFGEAEIAHVAERMHGCVAPGGWLVLGPSDPPLWQLAPFIAVLTDGGVFCRRAGDEPRDASRVQAAAAREAPRLPARARAERRPSPPAAQVAAPDAEGLAERARRLLGSRDAAGAERMVAEAAQANPASAELHQLHSMVLLESGSLEAAARAARRAIFLDPSLLVAHLTLGAIMQGAGRSAEALRAFRRAEALGAAAAPDAIAPSSNGETAAQLLEAARRQIAYITAANPGAA